MSHPWTCKIVLDYHRCPGCGFIVESRSDFEKRGKVFVKDVTCPRCKSDFSILWHRKEPPRPY